LISEISDISANHLKALLEISNEINSVLKLDTLLSKIMNIAMRTLDAERGFIILSRDKSQHFEAVTARNIDKKELLDPGKYSTSIIKKTIETKKGLLSHDALEDQRFRDAESVMALKIRSIAAVPLRLRDKLVGVIYVDSTKNRKMFNEKSLKFLEAFANQAALAIENARLYESLQQENRILKRDVEKIFPFNDIIGNSSAMHQVFKIMEKVARTNVIVLIGGESGTGKELVARAIHANGPRREKTFVGQYCGALQESLLESELFGHKKGAFTGAINDKKGLLEIADGGTFFLDEIAEISLALQTELLRVIQEGEIKRVGDTQIRKIDIRFISATNKILREQVQKGLFREDLYYRLNVIRIDLPPLRERDDDILLLAEHFLKRYGPKTNSNVTGFTASALRALKNYSWPGNVRELENVIQAALVMTDQRKIHPEHLSIMHQPKPTEIESLNIKAMTDQCVKKALKIHRGNRANAASELGVSIRWLQYRLKEIGGDI